jgi:tRNA-modifying protein YgfZ
MIAGWRDFLVNAGAELIDDRVSSFGNPDLERRVVTTGGVICDLSHFGLIAFVGEDARTFLQGQLTNDVRLVNDRSSQLTALCSPKGRMLANGRLFQRDDTLLLRLPSEMLVPVMNRLRLFVLRAKVSIEDASAALVRMGLSGPSAEAELHEAVGAVPGEVDEVVQHGGLTIIRVPGPHPRYEIYGERAALEKVWTALDVRAAPVGAEPWALLDIVAGIPTVYPQTADAFVPQMANMELIGGVSFRKGCYTGQEVVARSQFLGKLKRRMYRAHVDADTAPQPGAELHIPGSESGQSAGKIVDARPHPDGGFEVLAVLLIAAAESGNVRLGDEDGPVLQLATMPYSLEQQTEA